MGISFDNIANNIRTPGTYIEFNNELAGATTQEFKVCAIGQRLSTGSKLAGELVRVISQEQADDYFGRGSHLASIAHAYFQANPTVPLWCVALDDPTGNDAATGSIKIDSSSAKSGTLHIMIGGKPIDVVVNEGDKPNTIANRMIAIINSMNGSFTAALVNTDTVTITSRNLGDCGNELVIVENYYESQTHPAGIKLTITQPTGGAGWPYITPALNAIGDAWMNWFIMPFSNKTNIDLLVAELDRRWGPMVQKGARAFGAIRANHATTATWGNDKNSPHLSWMACNETPQPAYVWAAVNAAVASRSLSIDPARPLQTLQLTGLLPAKRELRWDQQERNQLLYDGIATHTVTNDGRVLIERQITTYQTNTAGIGDASYLDIQTPETLERIRYKQRAAASQRYPRHKRADDDFALVPGQAIVRPKDMRLFLLELYREMMELGWVENFEHYKTSLIVENDANDASRMNINDQPNLVNQFRVHAQKTQFIL